MVSLARLNVTASADLPVDCLSETQLHSRPRDGEGDAWMGGGKLATRTLAIHHDLHATPLSSDVGLTTRALRLP